MQTSYREHSGKCALLGRSRPRFCVLTSLCRLTWWAQRPIEERTSSGKGWRGTQVAGKCSAAPPSSADLKIGESRCVISAAFLVSGVLRRVPVSRLFSPSSSSALHRSHAFVFPCHSLELACWAACLSSARVDSLPEPGPSGPLTRSSSPGIGCGECETCRRPCRGRSDAGRDDLVVAASYNVPRKLPNSCPQVTCKLPRPIHADLGHFGANFGPNWPTPGTSR